MRVQIAASERRGGRRIEARSVSDDCTREGRL
jgi:hypothetical protein